ncbi:MULTISPECIES: DNA recombination protein RmuC [unclassified Aureispira]|uniref:DNA recombination protein RmuC n=1 Tax=unclassified Aureispira TaxID=2649989 RepID=UPI000697B823|nr:MULTISPECIES: DNA recombination protein RmuC [unclassified Aureispira]WMX14398.1 DNA recombination protein RmuC [Aureispira sp. CCB-E]
MDLIYLGIGIVIGWVLGYLMGILKGKSNHTPDDRKFILQEVHQTALSRIEKLENTLEDKEIECIDLNKVLASQEQIITNQKDKLEEQSKNLLQVQEQLRLEFAHTANSLLEEKSQKFTSQNQENLDHILKPLQEKLQLFEQKVELYYNDENKERATLKEQIRQLTQLNQQMNEETRNLTNALKGEAKTQGNWGELILERILEKSGLRKDSEYFTQSYFVSEDGKRQFPDLILNLPNKKHLIIDSKMSLTAYERFSSAKSTAAAEQAIKEHLISVKKHVKELSVKKYQQINELNTLDFVLMFIPLEAAFALAMQHDHNLYYQAFEQNVIIVSPMTLLATARTISNVWQQENQSRHAQEIAQQAGRMYDKFVNFIHDLEQVGHKIQQVEHSYNEAMKKLQFGKGNLVGRAIKLKELGAKTTKQLPEKFEETE